MKRAQVQAHDRVLIGRSEHTFEFPALPDLLLKTAGDERCQQRIIFANDCDGAQLSAQLDCSISGIAG